MTWVAVGGTAVMAVGTAVKSNADQRAADAAGNAAMAQRAEANQSYNQYANRLDLATTQGLQAFDKQIQSQEKNLSRQEQLISQIDPTVIEASQQALKLLRGQSASTLAPLQNQRNLQRQKLVNTLREQLGPGAETSTAGIQALTRFDTETSILMAGAQQSALGQLGQTAGQFNAIRPNMLGEITGLSNLNQGRTGLQYNQANSLYGANRDVVNQAGAQYVGPMAQANAQGNLGSGIANIGGMLTGSGLTANGGFGGTLDALGTKFGDIFGGKAAGAAPIASAGESYKNFGNLA